MVSLAKGTSRVGSAGVAEGGQPRASVGGRNFKVFLENERIKVGDGLMKSSREAGATSRKSTIAAKKGVVLHSNGNPKVKGASKSMEKRGGKYGTSANINVRKALADVSNVQGNSATTTGHDSSKMKVFAGSSTKIQDITLRKSFTGRVQRNTSQGTDLWPSLDDPKDNTYGGQSVVKKDRFTKKPILPTATSNSRKSLPVPKRVNKADMSSTKENAGSSKTAIAQSGLLTKATGGRRVSSQLITARNNVWKTRVSDGFVPMVRTNVLHTSSKKSSMPLKTKFQASTAQRTLKSKYISGQKSSKPTAAISSQDEEAIFLSLPENGLAVVSDDANQGHIPYDGDSNLRMDLSKCIPMKKSSSRKSYTTSLMERSKFLKERCEVGEEDNLPNIDNDCNQLEVSEYIDDIYKYYWVTETLFLHMFHPFQYKLSTAPVIAELAHNPALSSYMSIQTEISPHMRGILINWLIEVHLKFDLMPETLYLTVALLDQYLSLVTIKKTDMQLVGLTALLLASKYEDFWHPRVKDLISISVESYTRDQMLGMEKLILRKLKFRLNAPTPYVFMVRFLKAAQSDMKLEHMAFFLIDLCLVEYEALAFKPSLLCASALYVARCTLQICPPWTPLLQKHARYEVSQIRGCADMILKFHKIAPFGKLKVTYEKYSKQELSKVAAVKPLDMLPL